MAGGCGLVGAAGGCGMVGVAGGCGLVAVHCCVLVARRCVLVLAPAAQWWLLQTESRLMESS